MSPPSYLPLRAPHSNLCLTNYLPATDAPQMERILSDLRVAFNLVGPPYPHTAANATWWMNGREERVEKGEESGGFLAIRPIQSLLEDASPIFIGSVSLGCDPFYTEPDLTLRAEKVARNAKLTSEEGKRWSLGFFLDPTWGGKGIMTTAVSTYLHDHILPTYHIPPSSIRSAAFTDNVPSLKVQRACSFRLTYLVKLPKSEPNAKGRTNFDQYLTVFAPAGAPTAAEEDGDGDGCEKIGWEELEWYKA